MLLVVGALLVIAITTRSAIAHGSAVATIERPHYDIRVAVDVENRKYDLHGFIDVPATFGAPVLWLYADRLRVVPPSFDEFEAERTFTFGIEFGGYESLTVRVEGCPATKLGKATSPSAHVGRDVPIVACADAKRPLRIEIDGTVVLPRRYGTLGVARDTMTLGDPWYPLIVPSAAAIVPPLADHVVHLAPLDERIVASANGAVSVDEAHPVAAIEQKGVTHAPVVVLPTSKAWVTDRAAGVDLTFLTDTPERDVRHLFPVEGFEPTEQGDHWDIDAAGVLHGTLLDCVALLRRMGYVAADAPKTRGLSKSLVVVEIPERQRLAVDLPGMLLVSDHAFRLSPPWDRTRRFHGRPIARRAFAALIAPHLAATSTREDAPWVPDLDGSLLVDLLLAESSAKKEGAKALISFAAFHPSVDQLLYAPRVAFGAALFGAIEEPDPDRHGADRARNLVPHGQLVAEKLRDRLGTKLSKATQAHFYEGKPWREAAQAVADHDLGYFWKQWIGPHRKLAYRIVDVATEAHTTTITIERQGETWVREPVVVEVVDDDGETTRRTWDAPGAQGTLVFVTKGKFSKATLDPDGRLAEDATLVDGHPRFDNETSHVWRPPVFNALGATYTATERRLDFDFNFIVRRRFDVNQGFGFAGARNARGYSGSIRWFQTFGYLRDLNNRIGQWTLGLAVQRAPFGFALQPKPMTELALPFAIGWDTRLQLQDPRSGSAGWFWATPAFAKIDDGAVRGNVTMGFRLIRLFWEHIRSTTAVEITGATVLGPVVETQLLGVADRNQLRGFEADEFLARTRAYVIVEQRLKALTGLFLDAGHATWVKSLEVVPFGAIAAISSRDSAIDFKGKGRFVAELGMGLRFHHEYFGVQPGLIAIDFAVPFFRADDCVRPGQLTSGGFSFGGAELGAVDAEGCIRRRQKFGLYVSAEQTF